MPSCASRHFLRASAAAAAAARFSPSRRSSGVAVAIILPGSGAGYRACTCNFKPQLGPSALSSGMAARQRFGLSAQRHAAQLLRRRGMHVKTMPHRSAFDLFLENGKQVEVKAAHMHPTLFHWVINIHRHGKCREDNVDAYLILLYMESVGKKNPLALVVPAPVRSFTLVYTVESLLRSHHWQINNWSAIGVGPCKKPSASENTKFPVKRYFSR